MTTPAPATAVYLANSHQWLRAKLLEGAILPADVELLDKPDGADLIIYLEPPWSDDAAPDRLREFTPSELMRTFVYSQSDLPVPWAPGIYASLRQRRGSTARAFAGGFYVPHQRRESGGLGEHLDSAKTLSADLLWSFVGTVHNASVRRRIVEISDERAVVEDTQRFSDTLRWGWTSTHRGEAQAAFRHYATTLGRSKFVVCPRGRGPSSMRLFEALEIGRCPVIIADDWLPPLFVDWNSCSIRIPERDAERIPEILRRRESEADELGTNARAAWEQFFSPSTQLATLVKSCIAIRDRITLRTRLAVGITALAEPTTVTQIRASRPRLSSIRSSLGRGRA